ncbi:hypothetical protein [Kibdelosporangium philippinense]
MALPPGEPLLSFIDRKRGTRQASNSDFSGLRERCELRGLCS